MKINLRKTEGALILGKDSVEIVLPNIKKDEVVPDHVQFLIALACLSKEDEDFEEYVINKWLEITKNILGR